MSMILVEPLPLLDFAGSEGTDAGNLATTDPQEVWSSPSGDSGYAIKVDLGASSAFDTVALVGLNRSDFSWSVQAGAVSGTETTLRPSAGALSAPVHPATALWHGPLSSHRRLQISIGPPTPGAPMTIGRLVIGKAIKTSWSRDLGGGRRPVDSGRANDLPSGGFGIVPGARSAELNWTWSFLDDAELESLWWMAKRVGTTKPVLAVEDPGATSVFSIGAHYGLLQRFEPYRRQDPGQHRWSLSLKEWV